MCLLIALVSTAFLDAQEVTVSLQGSSGGCGLETDCSIGLVCFDVVMTLDQPNDLNAYNIWTTYDNTVLSRVNGGSDAACQLTDGGPTDLEALGGYRVAGTDSGTNAIPANTPTIVHTICFQILDFDAVGFSNYFETMISVGGDPFGPGFPTVVAFENPITVDDMIPAYTLTVAPETSPCFETAPVELIDLRAYEMNNDYVNVEWSTAVEINNDGFEIQRSLDGRLFETIGWVDGNGSTTRIQNYQYEDHELAKGVVYYYRLKQLDYDGKAVITKIVKASLIGNQNLAFDVFPNPSKVEKGLQVSISSSISTRASITVYDLLGHLVIDNEVDLTKGINNFHLKSTSLTSGQYFVNVDSNLEHFSKSVIIVD